VLRLLENDEITADEAGLLLDALDAEPTPLRAAPPSRPANTATVEVAPDPPAIGRRQAPKLRIRISDTRTVSRFPSDSWTPATGWRGG
jgi:hypothetical protein